MGGLGQPHGVGRGLCTAWASFHCGCGLSSRLTALTLCGEVVCHPLLCVLAPPTWSFGAWCWKLGSPGQLPHCSLLILVVLPRPWMLAIWTTDQSLDCFQPERKQREPQGEDAISKKEQNTNLSHSCLIYFLPSFCPPLFFL